MLFEDGRPLGPPGWYDPQQNSLSFSSSDNTDPNANGRRYSYRVMISATPFWVPWAALVIGGIAGLLLLSLLSDKTGSNLSRAVQWSRLVLVIIFLCGLAEAGGWILLERELFDTSTSNRRAYAWLIRRSLEGQGIKEATDVPTGSALYFAPHPFLNFVLNPAAAYMGQPQFNDEYLIRRTEPIRPRAEVAWRALVIGGSTTFGEGIANEDDTWVHHLEDRIRRVHGDRFDVINGG
jgi:hypothetical protein